MKTALLLLSGLVASCRFFLASAQITGGGDSSLRGVDSQDRLLDSNESAVEEEIDSPEYNEGKEACYFCPGAYGGYDPCSGPSSHGATLASCSGKHAYLECGKKDGKCEEKKCPEGSYYEPYVNGCFCLNGKTWDRKNNVCRCRKYECFEKVEKRCRSAYYLSCVTCPKYEGPGSFNPCAGGYADGQTFPSCIGDFGVFVKCGPYSKCNFLKCPWWQEYDSRVRKCVPIPPDRRMQEDRRDDNTFNERWLQGEDGEEDQDLFEDTIEAGYTDPICPLPPVPI